MNKIFIIAFFFVLAYNAIGSDFDSYYKHKGWKQLERNKQFVIPRADSNGILKSARKTYFEYQKYKHNISKYQQSLSNNSWELLGPNAPQIGTNPLSCGSGRINCIEFDPQIKGVIWAGAASGGLWKSTNNGQFWEPVQFTQFMSVGISDIAISKRNPNLMYAATGDADGGRFLGCYSLGMIKSTDRGQTWNFVNFDFSYDDNQFISRVLIHPNNDSVVFVGSSKGIFKSIDAGNSWYALTDADYFRDIEFAPDNPNIMYASTYEIFGNSSIYQSDDAGEHWFPVRTKPDITRSQLCASIFTPGLVYAVCSNYPKNDIGEFIKSMDYGMTWQNVKSDSFPQEGQCFYNLVLTETPLSDSKLYIGGVRLFKFDTKTGVYDSIWYSSHVDNHDVKFNPHDSMIYLANDGGIYRKKFQDSIFENISSNLSITQFYKIGLNPLNDSILLAGAQDNNLFMYDYSKWKYLIGGDGMECFFDYDNPSTYYGSIQQAKLSRRDIDSVKSISPEAIGETKPWLAPFIIHPQFSNIIYAGVANLYVSEDRGNNWTKISNFNNRLYMRAIAVADSNPDFIYCSNVKDLFKTTDRGKSWVKLAETSNGFSSIAINPNNYDNIFVAVTNYDSEEKVFEFEGQFKKNITYNLPNVPVNCIIINKKNADIYIATDLGVFYLDKILKLWLPLGKNLPEVIISEIEINYGKNEIYAASFGRGAWKLKLGDCQIESPIISSLNGLDFCIGDTAYLQINNPSDVKYKWSNGETGSSIKATKSDIYYASAINNEACISASNRIELKFNAIPEFYVYLKTRNPACVGDTVVLEALSSVENTKYYWSDGSRDSIIKITKADKYYCKATLNDKCFAYSDTVDVVINPLPEKPILQREGAWLNAPKGFSYQWFYNNQIVDNNFGNSMYIEQPGIYKVQIVDNNFCYRYSEDFVVPFAKDTNQKYSFIINNSPSSDFIELVLWSNISDNMTLEIYSLDGKLLYNESIIAHKGIIYNRIALNQFAAGTYYIQMKSAYGIKQDKFVVIR